MTATPSARTSMVVVPLAIFGDANDNAAGQEWIRVPASGSPVPWVLWAFMLVTARICK
jgi:hypothetical protein